MLTDSCAGKGQTSFKGYGGFREKYMDMHLEQPSILLHFPLALLLPMELRNSILW